MEFFICCILLKSSNLYCDLLNEGQSFCICNLINVFYKERVSCVVLAWSIGLDLDVEINGSA